MRRWPSIALLLLAACAAKHKTAAPPRGAKAPQSAATAVPPPIPATPMPVAPRKPEVIAVDLAALEAELVKKHGEPERPRIARGLKQIAALWRAEDGDLAAFAKEHYLGTAA